jgi:hypothetical protein
MAFGHPCPVSDLFGVAGRRLLEGLALPGPWAADVTAALRLIEILDGRSTTARPRCGDSAPLTPTCR